MKENKLVIQINKPISEVFEFTTNPKNTSLWLDSIVAEETNEWPVRLGTIYKNREKDADWNKYEVTEFERDKKFTLSQENSNYHVQYIYNDIGYNNTELTYFEWVEDGELDDPFTMDTIEKLKDQLEKA